MDKILLLVKNKRVCRMIEDWLSKTYEIVPAEAQNPLAQPIDLAIVDGPSLKRFRSKVRGRRNAEMPVFLPFLLLTVRRKDAVPARHLGNLVDDLVARPLNQRELLARVGNLLRMRRLSLDLKKEHDRVVKLSVTDDVSGFHNTRYLHRYLDRLVETPRARTEQVSLVFFDLDNFKQVVDTHGHLLGAKVLREVAQAVGRVLNEEDRLVRYGGDEFVAILPRQGKARALAKVQKMKQVVAATRFLQKERLNIRVTASFGLATYPRDARDKRELLAAADRCLFRSKSQGKGRICYDGTCQAEESEDGEEDFVRVHAA